jgi:hypothetical protein
MMSALIGFVRELGLELVRRADAIDAEPKEDVGHEGMIVLLATATTLRQVGAAVSAAAKKTFLV